MNTDTKSIWLPQAVVIAMLLYAAMLLYGPFFGDRFYLPLTLLKWICCPTFAYLALEAWKRKKTGWVWVFGTVAVGYNPILRVHSNLEMSIVVILVTIGIAIASLFVLNSNNPEK